MCGGVKPSVSAEIEDLRSWGAPQEIIDKVESKLQDGSRFPVYSENWPVVDLFLRVQTQWARGPMGHRIGLNYQGVDIVAEKLSISLDGARFRDLQIMELAMLKWDLDNG